MKPGIWWILTLVAGCGVVEADDDNTKEIDADVIDGARPDVVEIDAGPLTGRDCKDIHTAHPEAPSGTYTIDPDATGAEAPLEVHCDMTTRGGGWTLVFVAAKPDNAAVAMPYTSSTPTLLGAASETLVVFRDDALAPLDHDVRFAFPEAWRARSPFETLEEFTDHTTQVSQDGGEPIQEIVRYGRAGFSTTCEDTWTAGVTFGRFCITRTMGTFYSGWAADGPADFCSPSNLAFNAALCSTARQFTLAIR